VNWTNYSDVSRRLSAVRQVEAQRLADVEQRVSAGRAAVGQLRERLAAQQEHLTALALRLREPRPSFGGVVGTGLTDVGEAVRRAQDAVASADAEARRAEERAYQPVLLPGMSSTGRNAVVYLGAACIASMVSCGLWFTSPDNDLGRLPLSLIPWSLCGYPAMAFFAGYLTIAIFGRSRLEDSSRAGNYSVRLGGLICFGGMAAFWLLMVLASLG
jgi:hypothetical protein